MLKKAIIILIGIILLASCQSGKPLKRVKNDNFMFAMIYDHDNTPVSAVSVSINGKRITDSDIQGRFILDNMKKGDYNVKLVKRGYETLEDTFTFDPMNVLYFKMINSSQLVTLAESALDNREFIIAENFINRALVLEPNRPDILFLKGITCHLQGKNEEALLILENLIKTGNTNPFITQLFESLR